MYLHLGKGQHAQINYLIVSFRPGNHHLFLSTYRITKCVLREIPWIMCQTYHGILYIHKFYLSQLDEFE